MPVEPQPEIAAVTMLDLEQCHRLAIACRVLASEGLGDMIWGHASLRSKDDPNVILIKPHKMGFEEVTAGDIIGVNLDGERIAGVRPKHLETYIHTEIMRARADIQSVVHVHAPSTVVFSALGTDLKPIGHEGALFQRSLRIFDETTDLIKTSARGAAVARALGDGDSVLLQNHGLVTAADTLEGAVLRAIFLEKACRAHLSATASGVVKFTSSAADCDSKRGSLLSEDHISAAYAFLARGVKIS